MFITKGINKYIRKKLHSFNFSEIAPSRKGNRHKIITHISAFGYSNIGDTLLPITLRDAWNIQGIDLKWRHCPIRSTVDDSLIKKINRTKGVVIGGGGLFLKDTNPNPYSGWQWPCSIEMLEKIKVPIVLFAVGYNRFRNQEEFEPIFAKNLKVLAEKAVYIGARNHGSIKALKRYLPETLHNKIILQPCTTTIISKLYPDIANYNKKDNFIALNAAFDRPHLRFGNEIGQILTSIAIVMKELSRIYPVKFYSHMRKDQTILPFLDAHNVRYKVVDLQKMNPRQIIREYARPKLVIGMRGHAQMIPFGCVTPIMSIVSHDKMQYFLDDIGQSEWGADVLSKNFEKDLLGRSLNILNNLDISKKHIAQKQEEFYKISLQNINSALQGMLNKV